jgi:TolA-binding protein
MPLRTVYRCEQELKDKGILQVVKAERSKDIAGLKQEVRVYDFSKYFQAIAYILRHQQDQLNKHEKDIEELKRVIELRSDNAHTRQFEKNVIQAITELSKQLNELKKTSNKS